MKSQTARILDVLQDGRWHLSRELHERCGYMRTNSRIAELRGRGHIIEGESVPGKTGTDGYRYRLHNLGAGPQAGRASHAPANGAPTPTAPAAPPILSAAGALQLSLDEAAA